MFSAMINAPVCLSKGDRVQITGSSAYGLRFNGLYGTVERIFNRSNTGSIGVRIDGMQNSRSYYNCFYFKPDELALVEKGNNNMATIMDGNYTIADVSFIEGQNTTAVYPYALYDDSVDVDDIVVVKSASHGFGLAKVQRIRPKDNSELTREIVCKADFTAYNNRIEARKKRKQLLADMQARAAKLQEFALYQTLAAADPEMAKLLNEYNNI